MNRIAVVIPAHNEERSIARVAEEAARHAEWVIVVDDGSRDGTWNTIRNLPAPICAFRHLVNLGKGAALKTGCAAAVERGATVIVTLDADGQHPPACIPGIVRHMDENGLQFVFGERAGGDRMPFIRRAGNYAINQAAYRLFNLRTRDAWCGFRAFRASCLPRIGWKARDYSGEVQMALAVGRSGMSYGSYLIPTIYEEGAAKGVHILHGLKLLAQMALWRMMS